MSGGRSAVALGGKLSDAPLTPEQVGRVIKKYARAVGIDPAAYSGHSLRAGFCTSAAEFLPRNLVSRKSAPAPPALFCRYRIPLRSCDN